MSRSFLVFGVTALIVILTTGTDGQYIYSLPNTQATALNANPYMCTRIITTAVRYCPHTVCFMKSTVGICCMGVFKTAYGGLYQQCLCPTNTQCVATVVSTASTPTSTTSTTTRTTATTTTPTTTTTNPTTTTTTPTTTKSSTP